MQRHEDTIHSLLTRVVNFLGVLVHIEDATPPWTEFPPRRSCWGGACRAVRGGPVQRPEDTTRYPFRAL